MDFEYFPYEVEHEEYAAAFVIGGHANGLTEWKTADGKTLKEIDEEHNL